MLAVAATAMEKAPPPAELSEAWKIDRWGSPVSGGWSDWPAGLVLTTNVCLNIYNAMKAYRDAAGKSVAWSKANPDAWNLVTKILKMRMEAAEEDEARMEARRNR